MTVPLFKQYADYLFQYARLEERQDSLRRIFNGTVLEDEACMSILLQHRDAMQAIVAKAGDDAQDFKDKMSSLWDNKYADEEPNGFEELMDKIGVIRIEPESQEIDE